MVVDKTRGMHAERGMSTAKSIVRIAETNLDGNKPVFRALLSIKGISFSFANAISKVCDFSEKKVKDLSEDEINKLEDIIAKPFNYGIPPWLYNRRRDPETGENLHLIASQIDFKRKMDIEREKRIRSWRGVRHMFGLPVRGQSTRNTGKGGKTVGVQKKKSK